MNSRNYHEITINPMFGCVASGGKSIKTNEGETPEEGQMQNRSVGDCTAVSHQISLNFSSSAGPHLVEPVKLDTCECHIAGEICSRNENGSTIRGNIRYQSSAYVQNLAEISNDILYDSRWRVSNKQLFQWERGDDMSALIYLSRLFLTREQIESTNSHDIPVDDEIFARCMNLYSRLFHRKGPWFQIQDVFIRYYHRDNVHQQKNDQASENCTIFKEKMSETVDQLKSSVTRCMEDLCRLQNMGLIRTFLSEEECGSIIGEPGSKLLIDKDKMNLLGKLGAKSSKDGMVHSSMRNMLQRTENVFLKQMKSQKSIIFSNWKQNKVLPIKRHVDSIILTNWTSKLTDLSMTKCSNDHLTEKYLKTLWQSVASDLNSNIDLFTCFRLREGPLQTLRRACRLYLCAGDGPGSMRFTGANAWIPVRETKENFVVRRQQERTLLQGICNLPEPPTASLWHQVEFHGLKHRMGLSQYNFVENYFRLQSTFVEGNQNDEKTRNWIEVFRSISDFQLWEFCAEIRCILDYLMEWNRMVLYADRKLSSKSKDVTIKRSLKPCVEDQFCVLSDDIRASFLEKLLSLCGFNGTDIFRIQEKVETMIQNFLLQSSSSNETSKEGHMKGIIQTDAERTIAVLGIICQQVLLHRLQKVSPDEVESFLKRPWLRHLHPESVLAYIVWDSIAIIERRNFYDLATDMLETILFGYYTEGKITIDFQDDIHGTIKRPIISHLAQLLLSRRVRGKAFERLLIDKKHVTRQEFHSSGNRNKKRKVVNDLDTFTTKSIRSVASASSIPFSFIRKFCRRLKMPILRLFGDIWSIEMLELGIRLHETSIHEKTQTTEEEWTPKTDLSVANALDCEANNTGKRCSFVSSEESDGAIYTRSLNVEELAMEEYMAGRLPKENKDEIHKRHIGKWTGWHCEGVHVRVLFRLLCNSLLVSAHLGDEGHEDVHLEQLTVFLNSYQAAPLDLHVAHAAFAQGASDNLSLTYIRGFYERRRNDIEVFLRSLEQMPPQELSDLVFDTVLSRVEKARSLGKKFTNDHSLLKDYQQVRTLSMLAAGFGGKLLASMFRSLCFDYRHYGAGLPDLLLVRAIARNSKNANDEKEGSKIIDLSEWIGEVFQSSSSSPAGLLYDIEDEFLGASLNERQAKLSTVPQKGLDKDMQDYDVPQRLILSHDGCPVTVECMFVEVKSHNDKLDVRQEDWLNIIDNHGHARVCKFQSTTTKIRKSV